jgi:hypothetical protein
MLRKSCGRAHGQPTGLGPGGTNTFAFAFADSHASFHELIARVGSLSYTQGSNLSPPPVPFRRKHEKLRLAFWKSIGPELQELTCTIVQGNRPSSAGVRLALTDPNSPPMQINLPPTK